MTLYVRPYVEITGQIAYASSVNKYAADFYALQAGNINSANLATSGVDTVNLNGQCVTPDKIDGQVALFCEVFL